MHLGPPRKSDPYRRVLGAYQPAVVEVTLNGTGHRHGGGLGRVFGPALKAHEQAICVAGGAEVHAESRAARPETNTSALTRFTSAVSHEWSRTACPRSPARGALSNVAD